MEFLIARFGAYLKVLIDNFYDISIGESISFYIVCVFLAIMTTFFYRYFFRRIKLNQTLKSLNVLEVKADDKNNKKNFDAELVFQKNFNIINNELLSIGGIKNCWKEFAETIIHPKKDDDEKIIRNTVRPSEFFSLESANFKNPVLSIMPNLFVGIGLFFTFVGLVAALTTTTDSIKAASAENTTENIKTLLTLTASKFYISMTALGCSLIMNLTFKYFNSRLTKKMNNIIHLLESGVNYVSAESILQEQLYSLNEQTAQLKTFNNDLAAKLGDRIQDAVGNAMNPVADKLGEMAEKMGQDNLDAIREISQNITENVQGAAGDSLNALTDRLDLLSTTLGDLSSKFEKSSKQFETDINSTLIGVKDSIIEVVDTLKKGAVDASAASAEQTRQVTENLQKGASEITKALSFGKEIGKDLKKQMLAAGSESAKELSQVGKKMSGAVSEGVEQIQGSMGSLNESISSSKTEIGELNKSLANTSSTIKNVTSGIKESLNNLNNVSSSLKQSVDPITKSAQEIKSSISLMEQKVTNSSTQMQNVMQSLRDNMDELKDFWSKHSGRWDETEKHLGDVLDKVNQQIEGNQERLTEAVTQLNQDFTGALGSLSETVEDINDLWKKTNN